MKFLGVGLLWQKGEPDIYGQPSYGEPIPVQHRWQNKSGLFITREGRTEGYSSKVYVNIYAKPGDRISKRTTDTIEKSFEIKDSREIQNISGKKTEYRVLL